MYLLLMTRSVVDNLLSVVAISFHVLIKCPKQCLRWHRISAIFFWSLPAYLPGTISKWRSQHNICIESTLTAHCFAQLSIALGFTSPIDWSVVLRWQQAEIVSWLYAQNKIIVPSISIQTLCSKPKIDQWKNRMSPQVACLSDSVSAREVCGSRACERVEKSLFCLNELC